MAGAAVEVLVLVAGVVVLTVVPVVPADLGAAGVEVFGGAGAGLVVAVVEVVVVFGLVVEEDFI